MFWKKKDDKKTEPVAYVTGSLIECNHIFTDDLNRKWYEYSNHTLIPGSRAAAVTIGIQYADRNITPERLRKSLTEQLEHFNKGEFSQGSRITLDLLDRVDWNGEKETLIDLASIYFLIEGENEKEFSMKFKKIKSDYIKENEAAYTFFVNGAFQLTRHCSDTLKNVIPKYSEPSR